MSNRPLCALVLFATTTACGVTSGSAGNSSCKYAQAETCQDDLAQSALTLATLKTSCPNNGGVYSGGTCDRSGSIGGCKVDESAIMAGASIVTWYFPGSFSSGKMLNTTADVMAACAPPDGGSDTSYLAP
jgi:hypothetical protein